MVPWSRIALHYGPSIVELGEGVADGYGVCLELQLSFYYGQLPGAVAREQSQIMMDRLEWCRLLWYESHSVTELAMKSVNPICVGVLETTNGWAAPRVRMAW